MEYNKIKNADKIIENSKYFVKDPYKYKNKWHDLFGNKNSISLELGMGRGEFIINMAKKYPNKLINDDARNIDKIFGKEISTIYLTFCDPWPKKQDEKRRFTHESYLRIYDKIFTKHKHIILKTDNKGFFAYSLESLSNYWYIFNTVSLDLHKDERNIPNIMTNYEKQYQKEGRPIYYVDAKFDE